LNNLQHPYVARNLAAKHLDSFNLEIVDPFA